MRVALAIGMSAARRRVPVEPGTCATCCVVVDTSAVEVFADDGEVTFSALVFPRRGQGMASVVARGGDVAVCVSCRALDAPLAALRDADQR